MTYLSRLILNAQAAPVLRDLRDCQHLHRTVLAAFGSAPIGGSAREHFGVLFRWEHIESHPQLVRLLVQSAVEPDWSHLPMDYLGPDIDGRGNPAVREVGALYDTQIHTGSRLRFRLRANPTRRVSPRSAQHPVWHTKRVELRKEEDQLDWLARKGVQHGFRLIAEHIVDDQPIFSVRITKQPKVFGHQQPGNGPNEALRFGAVLFEGRLEVTDAELFRAALRQGIGSGKSYGFGLLSIATG